MKGSAPLTLDLNRRSDRIIARVLMTLIAPGSLAGIAILIWAAGAHDIIVCLPLSAAIWLLKFVWTVPLP